MRTAIDAGLLRDWAGTGLSALADARAEIDALNVYPVPDGDTGTNLYLTMAAAVDAVRRRTPEADPRDELVETARELTRGALLGARGNSGVILSQLLRGFVVATTAERVGAEPPAELLRLVLASAAQLAYDAVAHPIEGTMLSVARAAAEAARATTTDDLAAVVNAAADAARDALAQTPSQLPVLRRAGVVDAGGRGVVVLLDALVEVVTGVHRVVRSTSSSPWTGADDPAGSDQSTGSDHSTGGDPSTDSDEDTGRDEAAGPAYEVMYLLDAADDAVQALRRELDHLGDCLVVVGGDGLWNVHVHVDDAGAAVEAGIRAGRPHRVAITALDRDGRHAATSRVVSTLEPAVRATGAEPAAAAPAVQPVGWAAAGQPAAAPGTPPRPALRDRRVVVLVAHGPGVAELAAAAGAAVVLARPGRAPSTAELLHAIRSTEAAQVVLLPGQADIQAAAEAAAREARRSGIRCAVVPTRSVVQSLAALAVHQGTGDFDDDVVAMTHAAGATRYGAVTVAVRAAVTSAGLCEEGDVLGVVDGDIAVVGHGVEPVARQVLDRLLGSGGELATLVLGRDAPADLADRLGAWLRRAHPGIEPLAYDGGQALWPLIVGVE
ncbi:MAG: DAK2 domain-containing protein [Actinomycetota bacterium]|nr:MAG: DAK2 domain-containing protein [Actinomycetota bacterium]